LPDRKKKNYLKGNYKPKTAIMKKQNLLVALIGSLVLISCKDDGDNGLSATAKKNLEVNNAIMKAYEAGEFDKMKDYIAADAIDHAGEKGDITGLDSIVAEMKRYKAMMKDTKTEVLKEMADDEYVFVWGKFSGTMTADGMGMRAGDKMNMTSVDVAKFKDGKAVEHWMFMDAADVNKMMMSMMPPGAPPADTSASKPVTTQ
jgi:predicted ester cyclase